MNRRLRELEKEIGSYTVLYNESVKQTDKSMYKGKLECLKRKKNQILKRKEKE